MSEPFKTGDLLPPVIVTLTGLPVDLDISLVDEINFHMKDASGAVVINDAGYIYDPVEKMVAYDWQTGDTDVPGEYQIEFELVFAGKPITFPNDKNGKIKIVPAIA